MVVAEVITRTIYKTNWKQLFYFSFVLSKMFASRGVLKEDEKIQNINQSRFQLTMMNTTNMFLALHLQKSL
jgi:hypothetical protein